MGDPRRVRKKFSGPTHPWQKERIDEEKGLLKEYGLKNKTEIWKVTSNLRNFKIQIKRIIKLKTKQSEKEKIQLLNKLIKLGLLQENTEIEGVLRLGVKDILERRLQSVVFRKGLARSMQQARQFITHQHIMVNNKKITAPGFLVPKALENSIAFAASSSLVSPDHPERVQEKKQEVKEKKKGKKEKKLETKKQEKKEATQSASALPKESLEKSKTFQKKEKKKTEEKKQESKPKKEIKKAEEKPEETPKLSNESKKGLEKLKTFQKKEVKKEEKK